MRCDHWSLYGLGSGVTAFSFPTIASGACNRCSPFPMGMMSLNMFTLRACFNLVLFIAKYQVQTGRTVFRRVCVSTRLEGKCPRYLNGIVCSFSALKLNLLFFLFFFQLRQDVTLEMLFMLLAISIV